jgi:ATP-dependent Lon protease
LKVELAHCPDTGNTIEVEALMRAVIDDFTEYAGINKSISKELLAKVSAISDPVQAGGFGGIAFLLQARK